MLKQTSPSISAG